MLRSSVCGRSCKFGFRYKKLDVQRVEPFRPRIQAIEALKATHRAAQAQLGALLASLQQRAFAGAL
jgi:hypothetical protein